MTCEYCGESVNVSKAGDSLRHVTRDSTGQDPAAFLVIGGQAGLDALLHQCVIPEASNEWDPAR